jgi:hypothetical protein
MELAKNVTFCADVSPSSRYWTIDKFIHTLQLSFEMTLANIQRQLDPLAFDPTIKKLTS